MGIDGARPDFFYEEHQACVYVDGPVHDFPDWQARDQAIRDRLERTGFNVLRAGDHTTWPGLVQNYGFVFGDGRRA